MEVHTLEIDSSQRDSNIYSSNLNDYTVTLENPIYDITNFKLVSARIPTPQFLICESNRKLTYDVHYVDGTVQTDSGINFTPGNYDGPGIAALFNDIGGSITLNMTYDALNNKFSTGAPQLISNGQNLSKVILRFRTGENGYDDSSASRTTLHQILGAPPEDIEISNATNAKFGAANFNGPNSLVLKISAGSDEFTQTVYTSTPFYTGHILLDGSDFINFNGADDVVEHKFHSGSQKMIKDIRIQFFYMSHGRLIPYDFRYQDHILKFQVECNTGKFKSLSKHTAPDVGVLPPPISIPDFEDPYRWRQYVLISIILFFGVLTLVITRKKA